MLPKVHSINRATGDLAIRVARCLMLVFLFASLLPVLSNAQEYCYPLNRDWMNRLEPKINKVASNIHTDIKPIRVSEVKLFANTDSIDSTYFFQRDVKRRKLFGWFMRKLNEENFVRSKNSEFTITIDPVVNFEYNQSRPTKEKGYMNTRGFYMQGTVGKNVGFVSAFCENQARFPDYIDDFYKSRKLIPGQGVPKKFNGSSDTYDYGYATGYISYTATRNFNFQFGNGKNFIGDGYRSLLLSDNAFSYPFLKITSTYKNLQYMVMYTTMTDYNYPKNAWNFDDFHRKYLSIRYLSYTFKKRLTIGLFESVITHPHDSASGMGFRWNNINPIILARKDEFHPRADDNTLLGLNLKLKFSGSLIFYGQLIEDDININEALKKSGYYGNKVGYQIGFKYLEAFNQPDLIWQCEYNHVRPFTYSHYNVLQSYTHYGQELAHPAGANFYEAVTFINYRSNHFIVEARASTMMYGNDEYIASLKKYNNNGKNVFKDIDEGRNADYDYKVGYGDKTMVSYVGMNVALVINPKTNLLLEGGAMVRTYNETVNSAVKSLILHLGLRTSLYNFYYDF